MRDQLLKLLGLDEVIASGAGYQYRNEDGTVFFDALSQYGGNPLGASDPKTVEHINEFIQSGQPVFVQPFKTSHNAALTEQLLRITGLEGGQVVLGTSGADAVETALKICRVSKKATRVVSFDNGFHGKTSGALQVTGNPQYRRYFRENEERVVFLKSRESFTWKHDLVMYAKEETCAALIIELVQGEGGMRVLDKSALKELVETAKELGIHVVVDEIQTGLGRTGPMFAFLDHEWMPDIVLSAKALGAGVVPISACIAAPGVIPKEFSIYHSSTFSNNNMASSVSCHFLDRLEQEVQPQIAEQVKLLDQALSRVVSEYSDIYESLSGAGLMRGVHLRPIRDRESAFSNYLWNSGLMGYVAAGWLIREQRFITMPCFSQPSCLRIQPALNCDMALIEKIESSLCRLGEKVRGDRSGMCLLPHNGRFYVPKSAGKQPRQIIVRKPFCRSSSKSTVRKFQFALHPLNAENFEASCPSTLDNVHPIYRQEILGVLHQFRSIGTSLSDVCHKIEPMRIGDHVIEGQLYSVGWYAEEMRKLSKSQIKDTIEKISMCAQDYEADVLGLGGFTSIIGRGGFSFRHLDMDVTSGSCLTAAASVESAIRQVSVARTTFGIVGANGSIGSLCWKLLLEQILVGSLPYSINLLHNPNNNRAAYALSCDLVKTISKMSQPNPNAGIFGGSLVDHIHLSLQSLDTKNDPNAVVDTINEHCIRAFGQEIVKISSSDDVCSIKELDVALIATDQASQLESMSNLMPGAKVFDIGRPNSVNGEQLEASGIEVYDAGLIQFPDPINVTRNNLVGLPEGVLLGCLAETMVIAAAGPLIPRRIFKLDIDNARKVSAAAWRMGLEPAAIRTVMQPDIDAPIESLDSALMIPSHAQSVN